MKETGKKKDLVYYKGLEYTVQLKRRKDRFLLYIPELAIVEEDKDLNRAYEKLCEEKERYFSELIENDYQEYIKEPQGVRPVKEFAGQIYLFLFKMALVCLVLGVIGGAGARFLSSEYLSKKILYTAYRMVPTMDKIVSDMSHEEKEAFRGTILRAKELIEEPRSRAPAPSPVVLRDGNKTN